MCSDWRQLVPPPSLSHDRRQASQVGHQPADLPAHPALSNDASLTHLTVQLGLSEALPHPLFGHLLDQVSV